MGHVVWMFFRESQTRSPDTYSGAGCACVKDSVISRGTTPGKATQVTGTQVGHANPTAHRCAMTTRSSINSISVAYIVQRSATQYIPDPRLPFLFHLSLSLFLTL